MTYHEHLTCKGGFQDVGDKLNSDKTSPASETQFRRHQNQDSVTNINIYHQNHSKIVQNPLHNHQGPFAGKTPGQ